MAWEKQEFDRSVITSQFLNDFQDEVSRLGSIKQTFYYNEDGAGIQLPWQNLATRDDVSTSYLIPGNTPSIGDVVIGLLGGYICYVVAVSGSVMTVRGTGLTIH